MTARLQRVSVIGDGAMGTVCALVLAENGIDVRLWSNFPEQAADLVRARENQRFLPGHRFPDNLHIAADPDEAFTGAELIVSAIPCQFIRPVWTLLRKAYRSRTPIVTVSKGIEIATLMVSTQIIPDVIGPDVIAQNRAAPVRKRKEAASIAALSGPSIAPELANKQPCAVVVASEDPALAATIQRAFSNRYLRVYASSDVTGIEIAGAAKNVIALAAGIVDGIGAGCNAKAALLTRGVVEIARLGEALGASPATFQGLAGVGDLVTTCISPVGRNRSAGEKIGQGMSAAEVIAATDSVIEGIPTTGAVLELARRNDVDMPITAAVAAVLAGKLSPREAIDRLMTRELKEE